MGNSKLENTVAETSRKPEQGGESDIVSFWLLLLFVAVFFGIAAEEARRPMFTSTLSNPFATAPGAGSLDTRASAVRSLDLLSVEQERATGPIGRRGEKFEAPATGK